MSCQCLGGFFPSSSNVISSPEGAYQSPQGISLEGTAQRLYWTPDNTDARCVLRSHRCPQLFQGLNTAPRFAGSSPSLDVHSPQGTRLSSTKCMNTILSQKVFLISHRLPLRGLTYIFASQQCLILGSHAILQEVPNSALKSFMVIEWCLTQVLGTILGNL